jgi:hypothetical protein
VTDWTDADEVLRTWSRRARESQIAHSKSANRQRTKDRWLGVPAIVLSTVVGTSVFATLQKDVGQNWRITLAMLSILAAVLMTLHTSLAYAGSSERHRLAGARYAGIRRQIEETLALPSESRGDLAKVLGSIRSTMDKLAEESPALPPGLWDEGALPLDSVKEQR